MSKLFLKTLNADKNKLNKLTFISKSTKMSQTFYTSVVLQESGKHQSYELYQINFEIRVEESLNLTEW